MLIIVFLFGLAVGSFLNCLIYRLETKQDFLFGRSFCPKCHHILKWYDLIPLLSFLLLKGRCRYCKKKISIQYPLVELFTGILFLLFFTFHFSFFIYLISCFLIVIFVYDLKHYIIPDRLIYPAITLALFYQLFEMWNIGGWSSSEIRNLGYGLLPSLFLLAIILASGGKWMGFGDFKLAILMGLILNWPKVLVALFFSFLLGGIISIGLLLTKKKKLTSEVPFAPFLVSGTFIALFLGERIINWYLTFLK